MDIELALKSVPHHNNYWIERYLSFLDAADEPTRTFDKHHILPRAIFPEVVSFKKHPWNCIQLRPADHLFAHYYLYKALPRDRNAIWAFKLMVGKNYADAIIQNEDETLLRKVADAYEQVRFGHENSPSIAGWVRVYRDEEATVIPPEALEDYLTTGWVQTKPPYHWVTNGAEDRRVKPKDLQTYLDRGYTLGRTPFHTDSSKAAFGARMAASHASEREKGEDGFQYLPHGDQHHSRIFGIPADVRAKISEALTGRVQSRETVEKRRVSQLGNHWSWAECAAARLARSEAITGSKNHWHGTRGPMGDRLHTPGTRLQMSASHKAQYQDPAYVARIDAARPRGANHYLFGSSPAPETRAKIAASLTGKVQSVETIQKRIESRYASMFTQIPEEEHEVYSKALALPTEAGIIGLRQGFGTNSRPYTILNGIILIRKGEARDDNDRFWRQAASWVRLSGSIAPAAFIPSQLSKVTSTLNASRGVTRARQAYDEMPPTDHDLLTTAWESGSFSVVNAARLATHPDGTRVHPVRSRLDTILFGMELLMNGEALATNWERWRTAGIWIALSGYPCPLDDAAFTTLQGTVPGASQTEPLPFAGLRHDARATYTEAYVPVSRPTTPKVTEPTFAKGVKKAQLAFAAIPDDERALFLATWDTQDPKLLKEAQHAQVESSRPFKILRGLRVILEGNATPANWDGWRQAALFLRLSSRDLPLCPAALQALDRVCPSAAPGVS